MAFADQFITNLAESGVDVTNLDTTSIPDSGVVLSNLNSARFFMSDQGPLDPDVRDGFDEANLEERACSILADPTINAAPEIPTILDALDGTIGKVSDLLAIAEDCAQRADANGGGNV